MTNDAIEILSDKKLHEKFKMNARNRAEDFDIHKIVPKYENVYNDLN